MNAVFVKSKLIEVNVSGIIEPIDVEFCRRKARAQNDDDSTFLMDGTYQEALDMGADLVLIYQDV